MSANLPSGTVTFLFTDIEGSTKLWEQYPDAMRSALARHDHILRSAIEANNGYVFKTMGDAFCAAFADPTDALNAAISAQKSLHGAEWSEEVGLLRVRMALHTGVAESQEGDYFGQPLNRVARLISAGHGGQTLLSQPTYELVRDHLLTGVQLRDVGERRLKDLIRPEHVYQVLISGLPSEFPPLKTLDYRPNNLPAQLTALIGREKELVDLTQLLRRDDVRLVTLTGPGGMGKTRLALQLAADLLDDFADGVWFVDLSPITKSDLVISTIAQTFGVKESGGQPLLDTLKSYLKEKQPLLFLDNFEQVMSAATTVSEIMASCPQLKVLVTSRIALRLRGEREYAVPPLGLPDPKRLPPLESLTQYEAVRLFIERAQGVKTDFAVNNDNAPAVAEICARLDGLPLAIELAAARIKILPPQAMLSRLQNKLKMLTGGARDLPARQQTIRNTIEWSYDLLTPEEQKLFRRLAVFVGGRTLEAIEAVCNAEGGDEGAGLGMDVTGGRSDVLDVLDGVDSLVSKSLLRQEEGVGGELRFVMLETIHEYAREKLEESGEGESLQNKHADYFLAFAEAVDQDRGQPRALDQLELEHDNIRAAMYWTKDRNEGKKFLQLATALRWFWNQNSHFTEGRRWLQSAIEAPTDEDSTRAKALAGLGILTGHQGDYALAHFYFAKSLQLWERLGDEKEVAKLWVILGWPYMEEKDYGKARATTEQGLKELRRIGDKFLIAWALNHFGEVARLQGDYNTAASLYEESIALYRAQDRLETLPPILGNTAYVAIRQRDYGRASQSLSEALRSASLHDKHTIATLLAGMGGLASVQRQPEHAIRLFAAAETILKAINAVFEAADRSDYELYLASASSQLSSVIFQSVWEEGRAMTMEQAIAYALEDSDE